MRRLAAGAVAGGLIALSALGVRTPVSIKSITPRVCFAPCSVQLVVVVDPDAANQTLTVEVEGELWSSYSEIDQPENGPVMRTLTFRDLPPSDYEVVVALYRHQGNTWLAGKERGSFEVKGH